MDRRLLYHNVVEINPSELAEDIVQQYQDNKKSNSLLAKVVRQIVGQDALQHGA